MYVLAKYSRKGHLLDSNWKPDVSVIIASFNGGDKIFDKLYNTFDTYYPMDRFEVVVVMDGFCQETRNEIDRFVKTYPKHEQQVIIRHIERGGKEAAQKRGLDASNYSICVFTDVGTTIKPDTIGKLVAHFSDVNVGAVDGMSMVVASGHSNEGLYLKYENKIREWESKTSGLVGTGGCLFAARKWPLMEDRNGYRGFATDMQSDFRTALVMRGHDLRTVLDREAIAYFADGKESKEFSRKLRTLVRGYNVLLHSLHLLNPFKFGLFSYALFCHKVLKWTAPFFMFGAYIANAFLAYNPVTGEYSAFWLGLYIFQTLFYTLALNKYENKYGKIVHFFVMTNLAILTAWYSYITGNRYVTWEATKR